MIEEVNDPVSGYNEPSRLYGSDGTDAAPKAVLRRLNPAQSTSLGDTSTGRVQRQLGAVPSDFDVARVTAAAEEAEEIDHEVFTGGHSMVRAARTMHQYDINFWAPEGVVAYLTRSTVPAPSSDDIEAKYNDLLAFSYVPASMLPSSAVFGDLVNPQARQAFVIAALPQAGIDVRTGLAVGSAGALATQTETQPEEPTLLPVPFADNLQTACAGKNYFARSTGPLYSNQRKLA